MEKICFLRQILTVCGYMNLSLTFWALLSFLPPQGPQVFAPKMRILFENQSRHSRLRKNSAPIFDLRYTVSVVISDHFNLKCK